MEKFDEEIMGNGDHKEDEVIENSSENIQKFAEAFAQLTYNLFIKIRNDSG